MKRFVSPAIAGIIVFLATTAWDAYVPVVIGMNADFIGRDNGIATARVKGWKLRDCEVVQGSFVGWHKTSGEWHETAFSFPDDTSPDSTRPNGWARQNFGLFQWQNIPDSAKRVRLSVQHDCAGDIRTTIVGNWRAPLTSTQ